jgi:hypothetical protein
MTKENPHPIDLSAESMALNALIDQVRQTKVQMDRMERLCEKTIMQKITLERLALWLQQTERERNRLFRHKIKRMKKIPQPKLPLNFGEVV